MFGLPRLRKQPANTPAANEPVARPDSELLLRRLEFTVLRRLDGLLQGDYRTLFRGFGLDLADLREYQLHDDVRYIDWNVTARLQTPHVREFQEDREVEEGEPADPLTAFLSHAALEAGEHQAGEGQDALQMMTVHSAKGLEFDVVFLTGLEEGLFPHEQSAMEKDGLEEERRLAYVAITRARNRLYLSHAQTRMLHGQTRYNVPSRFLEEIPEGLLKWLTPRFSKQKAFLTPDFSRQTKSTFAKPKEHESGFRIGQNVVHPKYGAGVIVDHEGPGADVRVQGHFKNARL
jgi:DNA helicase-2/ATP-dependent DNA helicase PcrA